MTEHRCCAPCSQEGANHLAATGSQQSFTVGPAAVFGSSCIYTVHPKNDQRLVTVRWHDAVPGVTLVRVSDGKIIEKVLNPSTTGSWSVRVKTGVPTYELRAGSARNDSATILVGTTSCDLPLQ